MKKPQTDLIPGTETKVELYISYIVKNYVKRLKVKKKDS